MSKGPSIETGEVQIALIRSVTEKKTAITWEETHTKRGLCRPPGINSD